LDIAPRTLLSLAVAAAIATTIFGFVIVINPNPIFDTRVDSSTAIAEKFPLHMDARFSILPTTGTYSSNSGTLLIQNEFVDPQRYCEFCNHFVQRFNVTSQGMIAAVPPYALNNIQGAKRITFFAMGSEGGEKIRFLAAGNNIFVSSYKTNEDAKNSSSQASSAADKFLVKTNYITLTNDWQRYQINISNIMWNGNFFPFAVQSIRSGDLKISEFYIKDITFDAQAASNSLN